LPALDLATHAMPSQAGTWNGVRGSSPRMTSKKLVALV
jgi:hypothetical protein